MESDAKTPSMVQNSKLHRMSYSDLKQLAKKHGIKSNMKAQKIISALSSVCFDNDESFSTPARKEINSPKKVQKIITSGLNSVSSDDIESFSTPAQNEINSSRKNKKEKFNQDQATPLATPRRGTYSLETPTSVKAVDTSPKSLIFDESIKGTLSPSKIFDASVLDMSNVTIGRGSERKLRARKVSFLSPPRTPSTPKNQNIKLRPKTPIASSTSLGKRVSFSSPVRQQKKKSSEKPLRTTPHPKYSTRSHSALKMDAPEMNAVPEVGYPSNMDLSDMQEEFKPIDNQLQKEDSQSSSTKSLTIPKVKRVVASNSAKSLVPKGCASTKIKATATPSSTSGKSKDVVSTKIKRVATPNFKKIHEKAFEKLESIEDYQKRKLINSAKKIDRRPDFKSRITKAKSKIPALSGSGIPFISSAPSTTFTESKYNLKPQKVVTPKEIKKITKENASQKSKTRFDLKASLSRKLGYKPYTGPVKPLVDSNNLNTSSMNCFHNSKEPVNKVIGVNRLKTRSVLKGVRTNKRFELQMKNRKLD